MHTACRFVTHFLTGPKADATVAPSRGQRNKMHGSGRVAGDGRGYGIVAKKIELGTKHECEGCGAKYYDLGVPGKLCPVCGVDVEAEKAAEKKKAEE